MEEVAKQLDVELEKYADIRKVPDIPPNVRASMTASEIKERYEDYLRERLDMTTLDVLNDVIHNAFGVGFNGVAEGSVTEHFCNVAGWDHAEVDASEYLPNVEA